MRTTGERIAGIFGATYVAIGLLGFVATDGVGFADTQGNDLLGIFEIRTARLVRRVGLSRWSEGSTELFGIVILDPGGDVRSLHVVDEKRIRRELRKGEVLWRR